MPPRSARRRGMVFCSRVFFFLFLPVVLAAYFLLPRSCRNALLLAASLFFYLWGEKTYIYVLLASVALNYVWGLWLDRVRDSRRAARMVLALAVAANLGLLIAFKYANFLVANVNGCLTSLRFPTIELAPVHLPLGISFFTFHALSYVVDVY